MFLSDLTERALKFGKNKQSTDTTYIKCADLRHSKEFNRKDMLIHGIHRESNYTISLPGSYLNFAWNLCLGLVSEARCIMISPVVKDRLVVNFHADCAGMLCHFKAIGLANLLQQDKSKYFKVEQYLQLKYLIIFCNWFAKEFPETQIEIFYSIPSTRDINLLRTYRIDNIQQIEDALSLILENKELASVIRKIDQAVERVSKA